MCLSDKLGDLSLNSLPPPFPSLSLSKREALVVRILKTPKRILCESTKRPPAVWRCSNLEASSMRRVARIRAASRILSGVARNCVKGLDRIGSSAGTSVIEVAAEDPTHESKQTPRVCHRSSSAHGSFSPGFGANFFESSCECCDRKATFEASGACIALTVQELKFSGLPIVVGPGSGALEGFGFIFIFKSQFGKCMEISAIRRCSRRGTTPVRPALLNRSCCRRPTHT